MLIKNGLVLLFEENGFVKKDILVQGDKIVKIEDHIDNIEGEEIVDATGKYITPGFIDAHTHLGVSAEKLGGAGDECNDMSSALSPQLMAMDAFYPFDGAIDKGVRFAGVTCATVCPGSDSVVGGVISTIKLNNATVVDDMLVTKKTAMKCSFGKNPKVAKQGFASRMGVAYHFRKNIEDALEYKKQKELAIKNGEDFKTEMGMENMLLVLNKEIPFHAHVHRADDICTVIRLAQEYDFRLVLIHCSGGIEIKEYLGQFDYPVIVGPTTISTTKDEIWTLTAALAGELHNAGVKVCISADHEVTPIYYLPSYVALAVRYGLPEIEALKAVTKNPAEVLEIEDQKGQLKIGLDADIVMWTNHPLHYTSNVEKVWIEGKSIIDKEVK